MKDKEPLERWHGAHHYSDKIHLFLVFFLFFAIATTLWSYFEISGAKFSNKNPTTPTVSPTLEPSPTPTLVVPSPKPSCAPRPTCLDNPLSACDPKEPAGGWCPPVQKVFCTQEAKQCPDGSYVGRSGPNCAFAKCPPAN